MKARELRIGNLVEVFKDTYYPIVGISIENAYVSNKMGVLHCSYIELEPIPLTEEWLLKMGFEEGGIHYKGTYHFPSTKKYIVTPLHDKITSLSTLVSVIPNNDFEGGRVNLVCVDYVHQLQNLYFALTGEELTIKE